MTDLDLDAIQARAAKTGPFWYDVPDLIAEVRQLQARVADQARRLDMGRESSRRSVNG